jgi:hypothetical protein
MAALLDEQAELSRERAKKQASMAEVFRKLARKAAANEEHLRTTEPRLVMVDPPGPFDSTEIWEQFLTEVLAMADFLGKDSIVEHAELMISVRKLSVREP